MNASSNEAARLWETNARAAAESAACVLSTGVRRLPRRTHPRHGAATTTSPPLGGLPSEPTPGLPLLRGQGGLPPLGTAAGHRVFADRFRRAEPVITRAVERGELPAETDPVELLKTLAAPIYFRLLVSADPIEEGTADQAVRITLAAARAGALTQSSAVAVNATEADAGQA
ncbi:TetR-like C-terminal domain-containing protein [Streptomyces sp. NPDC002889]|uniref:TetR-like C-terminal domain-containing protein n=1 Tax=Streptomyces sp. NPDC002889 TaxID=3364669 RepID=UPI0036CC6485